MKKKKILISSFDLAIGGVERSLIGLLNQLDYSRFDVDLLLFRHEGEFMPLLPSGPNLLAEIPQYATFRQSIKEIVKSGHASIGLSRLIARYVGTVQGKLTRSAEPGYRVIQYGWKYSLPFLPEMKEEYDVAISFLWPHYFIGDKVRAKQKLGWVHTDYSNIQINQALEQQMWEQLDQVVAVSEECRQSFLKVMPSLRAKTMVIENIISPAFVREQALAEVAEGMSQIAGRVKLLTVGRLSFAKGIDQAAYACRKLVDQGIDVEWTIVGYGPLQAEIEEIIENLNLRDHFKLVGKKTNPYPYMRACDIYVQPSRYEGKAVTVREAQILGKPVLITHFPTAPSQVQDGLDGLITPMGVDGIVVGVKKLLEDNDLRKKLAANAQRRDYSNNDQVEKLYSLIESNEGKISKAADR
ncbi:glycosyl transferase [Ammoniphilus oxalaticus]|uniref:Glycosyl transferase n=1 Tax=Ammoniphilus oxalaticus TaxID=66863 RepID=A0A419SHA6_9BACL|nr:glycosyltransferase [Ammoniphilus oxalaticus]RKD23169.1 glycosyl transferase [Ammoniphilus oxalaticus]